MDLTNIPIHMRNMIIIEINPYYESKPQEISTQ